MPHAPEPTTTLSLDAINLASFDFWLRDDVHGALAALRRARPVAWHEHADSGQGFWSFARLDDVAAATRDWATFSSASGIQAMVDREDFEKSPGRGSMINMDPQRHTQLRGIVNRGFTPRMVARAEEAVRRRARQIVDAIAPRGEAEFVSDVAAQLPVAIICDMMGIPEPDRPRLYELTNRALAGLDAEFGGTRELSREAGAEIREYGLRLARERLAHPEEDMTTALVRAEVGGEALPPEELGPFFLLLVVAGNETTRNAISHGLWALTLYPDERKRWLADLDGRGAGAAEEIVRWASPVMHMRRTLTRDTEVGGVAMRTGDKVVMWYISANRDEAHFADPHRFDIAREPNPHGAFGTGGPHYCLGAHLARREMVVMFTELLQRLPDIEATAPPEKLRSNFIHGIKRLPVAFTPVG